MAARGSVGWLAHPWRTRHCEGVEPDREEHVNARKG